MQIPYWSWNMAASSSTSISLKKTSPISAFQDSDSLVPGKKEINSPPKGAENGEKTLEAWEYQGAMKEKPGWLVIVSSYTTCLFWIRN